AHGAGCPDHRRVAKRAVDCRAKTRWRGTDDEGFRPGTPWFLVRAEHCRRAVCLLDADLLELLWRAVLGSIVRRTQCAGVQDAVYHCRLQWRHRESRSRARLLRHDDPHHGFPERSGPLDSRPLGPPRPARLLAPHESRRHVLVPRSSAVTRRGARPARTCPPHLWRPHSAIPGHSRRCVYWRSRSLAPHQLTRILYAVLTRAHANWTAHR